MNTEVNDLMSDLKWSELASVEETLGAPMDEWESYPSKAKLSFALQYVLAKRNKPELTVEEAEQMTISQLTALSTPAAPKAK
jgi:type II secretory pathway predicted ATPase ExeA